MINVSRYSFCCKGLQSKNLTRPEVRTTWWQVLFVSMDSGTRENKRHVNGEL